MDKATIILPDELAIIDNLTNDIKNSQKQVVLASKDFEIAQLKLRNYLLTLYRKYSLSDEDQLMLEDGKIKYAQHKEEELNESNSKV